MLPWVVDVARAVRRTVVTNLMWAFGYNLVAVALAALGFLQPILAAAVMAGSSILVVLNSLRLERLPAPAPSAQAGRPSNAAGKALSANCMASTPGPTVAEPPGQPKMSWVNAVYQPSASRAARRRISVLSSTLLTNICVVLIVAPAGLKVMALLQASSGARKV